MNRFKKYCPNVWVAETEDKYQRGDIIYLETKYGKEVECEVYNLLKEIGTEEEPKFLYSIVRTEDMSYAERKAEKYNNSMIKNIEKSNQKFKEAEEGKEFLVLGEPIKVGHHSEKRHRALLERNQNGIGKAFELEKKAEEKRRKAEYWEKKANEINLSIPESLDYFKYELEKATEYHKKLKENPKLRTHSYSLTYAKKAVNDLKKKVEIAEELWGEC
ncbi:MAG: DUF3560 domain-containing protein [Peptoniphilaceae bacterium]